MRTKKKTRNKRTYYRVNKNKKTNNKRTNRKRINRKRTNRKRTNKRINNKRKTNKSIKKKTIRKIFGGSLYEAEDNLYTSYKNLIDELFDMLKQIIKSYFTLIKNKVKVTFISFIKEVSTNKEAYKFPVFELSYELASKSDFEGFFDKSLFDIIIEEGI